MHKKKRSTQIERKHIAKHREKKKKKRDTNRDREQQAEEEHITSALG